jgi:hypothetical protein
MNLLWVQKDPASVTYAKAKMWFVDNNNAKHSVNVNDEKPVTTLPPLWGNEGESGFVITEEGFVTGGSVGESSCGVGAGAGAAAGPE